MIWDIWALSYVALKTLHLTSIAVIGGLSVVRLFLVGPDSRLATVGWFAFGLTVISGAGLAWFGWDSLIANPLFPVKLGLVLTGLILAVAPLPKLFAPSRFAVFVTTVGVAVAMSYSLI